MPFPTGDITTSQFEDEIRAQAASLAAMFSDPALAVLRQRSPTHPAVVRYDTLLALLPRRSRPYHENLAISAEVGAGMIDRQFWMPDPDTDEYWSFIPDAAAAARVAQNIRDPRQFNETLAEVRVWSRLRQTHPAASLVEQEGQPDIRLDTPEGPLWIEVKFIHSDTSNDGVERALKKANKQLRTATGGDGGVLIMVFERTLAPRALPATEEAAQAARLPSGEDPPPADIASRIGVIEQALSSRDFKSVGVAILTWEDHCYVGEWPEPVTYIVRHSAVVRRHHLPRGHPEVPRELASIGGWAAFRLGVSG